MDNISAHKLRQLNRDGAKKSIKRAAKVLIADYVNQTLILIVSPKKSKLHTLALYTI